MEKVVPNKATSFSFLKAIYILLGFISFGLGSIGIIIPILPTVPFYLLTAFFFAKGSERFHKWFLSTKLYNKYGYSFAKHKTMSITGVLFLMVFVSLMLLVTMYYLNSPTMTIIICILIASKYTYFISQVKIVSKHELLKLTLSEQVND